MGPAVAALGAEHVVEAEAGLVVELEVEADRGGTDFHQPVAVEVVKGFNIEEGIAGGGQGFDRKARLQAVAGALGAVAAFIPDHFQPVAKGHADIPVLPTGSQFKLHPLVVVPAPGGTFAFTVAVGEGAAQPGSQISGDVLPQSPVGEAGKVIRQTQVSIERQVKAFSVIPFEVIVLPGLEIITRRQGGCGKQGKKEGSCGLKVRKRKRNRSLHGLQGSGFYSSAS